MDTPLPPGADVTAEDAEDARAALAGLQGHPRGLVAVGIDVGHIVRRDRLGHANGRQRLDVGRHALDHGPVLRAQSGRDPVNRMRIVVK